MQANQNQNILNTVHEAVQSNVSKMYKKIDDIIQSAKNYVEQSPKNGQKIVDYVTSYTKYMHKVIEQIVQLYSELLNAVVFGDKNPLEQISQSGKINAESLYENSNMETILKEFKNKLSQNIKRAQDATAKIQSLIAQLVE